MTNNTMDKSKKYKERSTKHTYKTKDRVTRTSLKTNNTMDKSKKYKERSYFLLLSIVLYVFSGVLVTRSLVLYVCFVDHSLYFLLLSIVLFVFSGVLVTRSLVLYVWDRVTRTSLKTNNTMDKSKKYKERSTKHTYKTKDLVTRTPLKTYNTMDKSKKYKERSKFYMYVL
jgi:hypothetical protein